MKRKTFDLVLRKGTTRLTGEVGAVWLRVDSEVGGGSTIRPSRVRDGVWTVQDCDSRDVGVLYAVEG